VGEPSDPIIIVAEDQDLHPSFQTLRKKIESDLARKRPGAAPSSQSQQQSGYPGSRRRNAAQKGTVASLRPSPALTVPESMSVSDASQLCAAKRTDCVLVVDDEEGLSGIFTAKDLAFRVSFGVFAHRLQRSDVRHTTYR
jgi:CBS domain containing-hemolysin-like protein